MTRERLKDVLTTGEVAKICNVAPRTVSKWFDTGQLRGYRIPGSKDRRIPRDQLVRFMRAHDIPLNGMDTGGLRVLVVDEDEQMCRLLSETLEADRFEVSVAASAFEAGVVAHSIRPAVIIIDLGLSDVDPRRICQALRSQPQLSGIKLVAVSGALTEGQGQALLQEGFAGFLRKPFDVRALRALVAELA